MDKSQDYKTGFFDGFEVRYKYGLLNFKEEYLGKPIEKPIDPSEVK